MNTVRNGTYGYIVSSGDTQMRGRGFQGSAFSFRNSVSDSPASIDAFRMLICTSPQTFRS
ncbi:MAG: hypothetical protein LBV41_08715 [Cytophagaceae bacterium]|nr:hypothetical protein [Cytophagaceae bacterium]